MPGCAAGMLMDSCGDGYHLVHWRSAAEHGVEWEEDTARIQAEVLEATKLPARPRHPCVNPDAR